MAQRHVSLHFVISLCARFLNLIACMNRIPHTRMGGNFANFFPDERTDWVAQTELDLYESRPSDSHVISFSTHGLRPDKSMESRLARSEILVALDIMMQRMLWLPHITNHIFPVCLSIRSNFIFSNWF